MLMIARIGMYNVLMNVSGPSLVPSFHLGASALLTPTSAKFCVTLAPIRIVHLIPRLD